MTPTRDLRGGGLICPLPVWFVRPVFVSERRSIMTILLRLFLCVGVLALALVGLSLLPTEPTALVVNPFELPVLLAELGREDARRESLDKRNEVILERINAKEIVLEALVAGKLKLWEAAARYADLETSLPFFNWSVFRASYPGRTDTERHCREVFD